MKCMVQFCKNKKCTRRPGMSFHRFPKNGILRQKWLQVIGQPNLKPTSNNFICSEHFLAKDIFKCEKRIKLSIDAVPNLKLNFLESNNIVPSKDESFIEQNATNFQDQSIKVLSNVRFPNMPPYYERREIVLLQEDSTSTIFIEGMEQTILNQEITSVTADISEIEDPVISKTLMQENSEIKKNTCKNKECKTKILSLQKQVKRLKEALRRRDKKIRGMNTALEILEKKELSGSNKKFARKWNREYGEQQN